MSALINPGFNSEQARNTTPSPSNDDNTFLNNGRLNNNHITIISPSVFTEIDTRIEVLSKDFEVIKVKFEGKNKLSQIIGLIATVALVILTTIYFTSNTPLTICLAGVVLLVGSLGIHYNSRLNKSTTEEFHALNDFLNKEKIRNETGQEIPYIIQCGFRADDDILGKNFDAYSDLTCIKRQLSRPEFLKSLKERLPNYEKMTLDSIMKFYKLLSHVNACLGRIERLNSLPQEAHNIPNIPWAAPGYASRVIKGQIKEKAQGLPQAQKDLKEYEERLKNEFRQFM